MNKYKVVVYAIAKNEEKFVKRWVESMNEADEIYVLDTGSTDRTVELLKDLGVNVMIDEIKPWRFDVARNRSLELVPEDTDICVCTDLDEVFNEGWRQDLERVWNSTINRLAYNYIWSFDEEGRPGVNFYIEKIHQRKDYIWTHPVHEVLMYMGEKENKITTDIITLNHYPDNTKSRSNYLPLLELSVEESPEDDRNMHYLGREYMYYGEWEKCIEILKRHLDLKTAIWKDERSASMRFIARSYYNLGNLENARIWYENAILEAPNLREPLAELAIMEYENKNYQEVIKLIKKALLIKSHNKTYINEIFCYNGMLEDILSVCLYNVGNKEEALGYAIKASLLKPNDTRIKNNIEIMTKSML